MLAAHPHSILDPMPVWAIVIVICSVLWVLGTVVVALAARRLGPGPG